MAVTPNLARGKPLQKLVTLMLLTFGGLFYLPYFTEAISCNDCQASCEHVNCTNPLGCKVYRRAFPKEGKGCNLIEGDNFSLEIFKCVQKNLDLEGNCVKGLFNRIAAESKICAEEAEAMTEVHYVDSEKEQYYELCLCNTKLCGNDDAFTKTETTQNVPIKRLAIAKAEDNSVSEAFMIVMFIILAIYKMVLGFNPHQAFKPNYKKYCFWAKEKWMPGKEDDIARVECLGGGDNSTV